MMTTARDVIAEILCRAAGPECDCGDSPCVYYRTADGLLASDSVRQELAALLNPWRPIETAPKDGTWVLGFSDDEINTKWSHCEVVRWRTAGRSGNGHGWYDSRIFPVSITYWLPLPAPPSED
jgi:hypothetical protein